MKFAVVVDWPEVKNAEYEVIRRIQKSAESLGHEAVAIDGQGRLVDLKLGGILKSNRTIVELNLDISFQLILHFNSSKVVDLHTYAVNWNPIHFYMDWGYQKSLVNLRSADEFLVYDSGPMVAHLINMLGSPRKIVKELQFAPSVPLTSSTPKAAEKPISLFYSGINWERLNGGKGRHHELFLALDKKGFMKFFGPEKFMGERPWRGFKSYHGELPFDGISTIDMINECGASLVLSSKNHLSNHAATNRLYESLEAGAIIISDSNPFITENFAGLIYEFAPSGEASIDAQKISELVEEIESNRELARSRATQAQAIYREKFGLEKQLTQLVSYHSSKQTDISDGKPVAVASHDIEIIVRHEPREHSVEDLVNTLASIIKQQPFVYAVNVYSHGDNAEPTIRDLMTVPQYVNFRSASGRATAGLDDKSRVPVGRLICENFENDGARFLLCLDSGDELVSGFLEKASEYASTTECQVLIGGQIINRGPTAERNVLSDGYSGSLRSELMNVSLSHIIFTKDLVPHDQIWWFDGLGLKTKVLCEAADTAKVGYLESIAVIAKELNLYAGSEIRVIESNLVDSLIQNSNLGSSNLFGGSTDQGYAQISTSDEEFVKQLKRVIWDRLERHKYLRKFLQWLNKILP